MLDIKYPSQAPGNSEEFLLSLQENWFALNDAVIGFVNQVQSEVEFDELRAKFQAGESV